VSIPLGGCHQRYVTSTFTAGAIAWDPHSANGCAAGFCDSIFLADCRQQSVTTTIDHAHAGVVRCVARVTGILTSLTSLFRDIDYNPNKPLTFVSCGDDRKVMFWDARNLKAPIRTLAGHSHWVWSVKYNPFHDQLLMRLVQFDGVIS
jgi:hypothetical protein